VPDLVIVLVIAAVAAVAGTWLGIVLIAPRLSRALDRAAEDDEDSGDRPA
jgi:ABC-type enterobactin transport system permease subunit